MKHILLLFIPLLLLSLVPSSPAAAQSWNFIKEKDGVKLYTAQEPGKSLKAYKGVTDIHAPAEKIFAMLEDVYHTDWWDKNISQIRVLRYEKYRRAQYYIVYDLPWPVTDRDLCVDVTASVDPVTGERRLTAVTLPGAVAESKDMVRIKEYRQTWTLDPVSNGMTHVVLEGFVDPAGTIPDWIANMLIVDSPAKVISEVKQRMEKR
jgi:hypothetical protein